MIRLRLALSLLGLLALPLAAARAGAENSTATVKFSDPTRPGTLRVFATQGDVKVRGVPEADASVTVRSDIAPATPSKRSDGLRVVSSATSMLISEKDNVVTLDYGRDQHPRGGAGSFDITVPANTQVVVTIAWGGEVRMEGVLGDVEVKNLNGSVSLKDIGGGALVESMNGEIEASFTRLPTGKPLSFTSMNGEILLRLPGDAAADLRFRTQNGTILTDFPEAALVTRTEEVTGPRPPLAPEARSDSTRAAAEELRAAAVEAARAAADAARAIAVEVRAAVEEHQARSGDSSHSDGPPRAPAAPRAPRAPRPPAIPSFAGGKVISGTLNGGGTDIQVATMNGDIVVRRRD
jgi:hypothetical protein